MKCYYCGRPLDCSGKLMYSCSKCGKDYRIEKHLLQTVKHKLSYMLSQGFSVEKIQLRRETPEGDECREVDYWGHVKILNTESNNYGMSVKKR